MIEGNKEDSEAFLKQQEDLFKEELAKEPIALEMLLRSLTVEAEESKELASHFENEKDRIIREVETASKQVLCPLQSPFILFAFISFEIIRFWASIVLLASEVF